MIAASKPLDCEVISKWCFVAILTNAEICELWHGKYLKYVHQFWDWMVENKETLRKARDTTHV